MSDFDTLTIPVGGPVLASIEPNIADLVTQPGFWADSPELPGPGLSAAGGNVRLSIPAVRQQEFKGPQTISSAMLSVRALYGTLLKF